jgi:hypothetical protein
MHLMRACPEGERGYGKKKKKTGGGRKGVEKMNEGKRGWGVGG